MTDAATDATELQINKRDLRETRIHRGTIQSPGDGEIVAAVERFSLTANNVSYAKTGDALGYWRFFPAEEGWGVVPVWGFAEVIASNHADIAVGERLYGYWPMASHVTLTPSGVEAEQFMDASPHRAALSVIYNLYRRADKEGEMFAGHEDARSLYFPLFMTSYLLYDYLIDNAMFGATQVVIGSASSKTGFGLAKFLAEHERGPKVIGVTGATGFAEQLGCYDQLVDYRGAAEIDANQPTVYVDMSGDGMLTETLHRRLGHALTSSIIVGATHWQSAPPSKGLPGAKPTFFFAPAQIEKRDKEWGPGVVLAKANQEVLRLAIEIGAHVEIERLRGAEAIAEIWGRLLENKVAPSRGIIASL